MRKRGVNCRVGIIINKIEDLIKNAITSLKNEPKELVKAPAQKVKEIILDKVTKLKYRDTSPYMPITEVQDI